MGIGQSLAEVFSFTSMSWRELEMASEAMDLMGIDCICMPNDNLSINVKNNLHMGLLALNDWLRSVIWNVYKSWLPDFWRRQRWTHQHDRVLQGRAKYCAET